MKRKPLSSFFGSRFIRASGRCRGARRGIRWRRFLGLHVPHLRFRAVSSTSAPPIDPAYDDLVALDNPYEPYTLASVTVLSADGSQSSTFRRVGQSLLLDDAPDASGRNAISWSIRID